MFILTVCYSRCTSNRFLSCTQCETLVSFVGFLGAYGHKRCGCVILLRLHQRQDGGLERGQCKAAKSALEAKTK
uniref:Uncharacterized protein n=1 Tax=Arundo donax TaxID=35708 RepID=A0A0A8ZJ57_ARUDO